MSDDLSTHVMSRKPTPERPLLGLTVLVVEDSRFASEAMRLLCLRSGARIRRADCLASAHRHLAVYRPSAVVVDLGLPDGSGANLIRELAESDQPAPVLLGTSGDPNTEQLALDAGADGFLEKPITSLALFQQAILSRLPADDRPAGMRVIPVDDVTPDRIALRDDLHHVAEVLSAPVDERTLEYIAQFLASVAQSASDTTLQSAASRLVRPGSGAPVLQETVDEVSTLVEARAAATGPI